MEISINVKTLIDQFELMARANAASSAPRSRSVSSFNKASQPKTDNSLVKNSTERSITNRSRTQSEPVQMIQTTEKAVEPVKELSRVNEEALFDTSMKAAFYKRLIVHTSDKCDNTALDSYDSTFCSTVPRSPSYSTASTCSLDSLLSSQDPLLSELLQRPGEEVNTEAVNRSRRPALHKNLQFTTTSKLATSNQLNLLARRPPAMTTKEPSIPKSTSCFSKSARDTVVLSRPVKTLSNVSSSPRYMNYASSPRYSATKAWNIERRRQLEERNRSVAADKAKLPIAKLHARNARRSNRVERNKCGRDCMIPRRTNTQQSWK